MRHVKVMQLIYLALTYLTLYTTAFPIFSTDLQKRVIDSGIKIALANQPFEQKNALVGKTPSNSLKKRSIASAFKNFGKKFVSAGKAAIKGVASVGKKAVKGAVSVGKKAGGGVIKAGKVLASPKAIAIEEEVGETLATIAPLLL